MRKRGVLLALAVASVTPFVTMACRGRGEGEGASKSERPIVSQDFADEKGEDWLRTHGITEEEIQENRRRIEDIRRIGSHPISDANIAALLEYATTMAFQPPHYEQGHLRGGYAHEHAVRALEELGTRAHKLLLNELRPGNGRRSIAFRILAEQGVLCAIDKYIMLPDLDKDEVVMIRIYTDCIGPNDIIKVRERYERHRGRWKYDASRRTFVPRGDVGT